MTTLTNNTKVEDLINSGVQNNTKVIKTFGLIIKDFLSNPEDFDYTQNQKSTVLNLINTNYFAVFEMWLSKSGLPNYITNDEFFNKVIKFIYDYHKVLENKNPFVYVVEFIDLEADDVMTKSLTKCVFVGESNGFANKSQAIAAFRLNKKMGKFEATKVGRHKIKYFKKPEVMQYNDLGFEFINQLVEFKI